MKILDIFSSCGFGMYSLFKHSSFWNKKFMLNEIVSQTMITLKDFSRLKSEMEKIIWLILKCLIKIKHKPPNFWRVIAQTTDVVQQQQQQIFFGAKSSYKRKVQSSTRVALGQMLLQSYTVPTKHDRLHYCINIITLSSCSKLLLLVYCVCWALIAFLCL